MDITVTARLAVVLLKRTVTMMPPMVEVKKRFKKALRFFTVLQGTSADKASLFLLVQLFLSILSFLFSVFLAFPFLMMFPQEEEKKSKRAVNH